MQMNKRRVVLLVGGLLIVLMGVVFLCYYIGCFQRRVVACRINFEHPAKLSIVLDDQDEIDDLVLKPMRLSRPDFFPSDYAVICHLVLEYEGGTVENYGLFHPLGHYKHWPTQNYRIANFEKLRREIKQRIQDKKGMEGVIKGLD
jgi:hypothetical protein